MPENGKKDGTVYLIHFERPVCHARHYMGWATDLDARLKRHRAGNGARLMEVVKQLGIKWQVVRTWKGPQALERRLKNQKNGPRLCPICRRKVKDE